MNDWLLLILSLSVSGSLLALLILALNPLWKKRLGTVWQYYIYLLVIGRLLIPFHTDINLVDRIFDRAQEWVNVSRQDEPVSVPAGNEDAAEILRPGPVDTDTAHMEPVEGAEHGDGRTELENQGAESGDMTEGEHGGLYDRTEAAAGPAVDIGSRVAGMLWLVWVLPGLFFFVRKAVAYRSFLRRMKLGCRRVKEERILDIYERICLELRIKHPPRLYRNGETATPMLAGIFRPFIMLPGSDEGISEGERMKNDRIEERTEEDQRGEEQLCHILRHELMHRKRLDILYKWLVQFTVCVHWFNPLVYLIRREIDRLCELSCDESLLKGFGEEERLRYGDTLLSAIKMQKSGADVVMPLTWNNDKKRIKERLDAIMRYHKRSKTGKMLTVLLTVVLLSAAAVTGTYAAEGGRTEKGETPPDVFSAREFPSGKTAKSTQVPDKNKAGGEDDVKPDIDHAQYEQPYDSYRTYEEARSDMEEGYVYYMNKSFSEELSPLLINDRRIGFQVHHENMLDISIRLENLRRAKRSGIWKPFTDKAFVRFELYNPDGVLASSFYKEEEELEEAVDLSAEIPVYPGEWSYKIEFAYATDGVNTSNLTVTMKYRDLYEDDVEWLFENKLRR